MLKKTLTLSCAASVLALSACASLPMKGTQASPYETVYNAPNPITSQMKSSRGLNVEALLANEVEQSIKELSKMEQSIAAVRAGMMDVIPSLKRLEVLHGEVAALNNRLRGVMETLSTTAPLANPVAITTPDLKTAQETTAMAKAKAMVPKQVAVPQPQPIAKKQEPKAAAKAPEKTLKPGVSSVRIGDHNGKTRLVLDIVGNAKPAYDLDNNEGLFAIEIPKTAWNTGAEQRFPKGDLISGYAAQAVEETSLIAVALKKPTAIIEYFVIKGASGKPDRHVFDLKN